MFNMRNVKATREERPQKGKWMSSLQKHGRKEEKETRQRGGGMSLEWWYLPEIKASKMLMTTLNEP